MSIPHARSVLPRRRGLAATAGALFASVLLLTGCGPTENTGAGQDKNADESNAAQAQVLGKVPMAEVPEMAGAMGMWATERNFVKADLKQITGYPPQGGKAQWRVPLSGEICWSSQTPTDDGLVAVLFQNDKDDPAVCTEVGLVDINKGKLLWQRQGKDADGYEQTFDEVTIGGGTVAAAGTSASAGWSVDGKPLWRPVDERCPDRGYAGDAAKLVAVRDCGDTDNPRLDVRSVDPRTRAVKSSFALPRGTEYAHVASTDPLVVAVDDGDAPGGSGISGFLSIDDSTAKGRLLSRISAKGGKHGKYEAECPSSEVSGCAQLAVSKKAGALYLGTTEPADASSDAENDVVAFSLKTGKRIGGAQGVDGGRLLPFGLDADGRVLAYQESNIMSEEGGAVWSVDPGTGKKSKLLQNPSASYEMESRFESDRRVLYSGERLYMGADNVTEPSEVYKKPQPLAVVFGAK
ncbi:hypothetical protein ACFQVC_09325 [Streptomyces monticola]|uniref:PQQ-like beta-propeller repeat protein n=1 Tax=Streptomyces monticola TaxID=2666263 RepID=A0ABW2JFE4_9ACTN